MIVKVCGMRQPANIEEVARLKPDMMGFIFYPKSKRYVGEDYNPVNVKSLMPEVQTVGVFVNEDYESLSYIAGRYDFDFIQLHGNESPEYCHSVQDDDGIDVIKAFGVNGAGDWTVLEPYLDVCKYFLFDTNTNGYGGSGKKFDWNLLENYKYEKPFLLSGGISPEDAEMINKINHPRFIGIDINSCFETEPGMKDINKLEMFLKKLR